MGTRAQLVRPPSRVWSGAARSISDRRRRFSVSRADAPLEREADRIADRVVSGGTVGAVATAPATASVHRRCSACEDELAVRRRPDATPTGAITAPSGTIDIALSSSGRPLAPATRAFMEPRFGYDFSRVRVHADDRAAASARALHAAAYTVGEDIVFASGRYDPDSSTGKHLLAHELAHTIQQADRAPMVQRRVVCPPGVDPAEGTGCYCEPDEEPNSCEAPVPGAGNASSDTDLWNWLRDHPEMLPRPPMTLPPFEWPHRTVPGDDWPRDPASECRGSLCHERHPNMRQRSIVHSCATDLPDIPLCASLPSEYIYSSASQALDEMKRQTGDNHLKLHNKSRTTEGPCPGIGTHWNVRSGKERVGSIACCPCCIDTDRGPMSFTRCRIIW